MRSEQETRIMKSELNKELIFLILQYLNEEKYQDTVHKLERESGSFFNISYFEEMVVCGHWEEAERYLIGFTRLEDNPHSRKIFFEMRKQKYLEALDRHDLATATEILVKDLKVFAVFNEALYKDLTHLLTLNNFRDHAQLSSYTNPSNARMLLLVELKKLLHANSILRDKIRFPNVQDSRLRHLLNQSFNWQHLLCKNPSRSPETKTLYEDHTCSQPPDSYAQPSSSNHQNIPISQAEAFLPLGPNGVFQPIPIPVHPSPFSSMWLHNVPFIPHPEVPRGAMSATVASLKNLKDSDDKPESSGISDKMKMPATSGGGSDSPMLNLTDELPMTVVRSLFQGSGPTTMDFHPVLHTLLLVGTNVGDTTLWDIGSAEKLFSGCFQLWDIGSISTQLKSALVQDPCAEVKRVKWCPDGSLFGVAYSKNILHLYSYLGENQIQQHLEMDTHIGSVNDLAFSNCYKQLAVITCGDDKTIKVWDVVTGAKLFTFKGHNAPVHSLCPHVRENVHDHEKETKQLDAFAQGVDREFILSTSMDGKIKAWLYDLFGSKVDYDAPGGCCTNMAYTSDGKRLFSCGTSRNGDTHIVEWIESEGLVKRSYRGFDNRSLGIVHFDTAKNRFLAAGDDHLIKFWELDNVNLLTTSDAGGDLLASPPICYNKEGTLLAVCTKDNRVKILATLEGIRSLLGIENCAIAKLRNLPETVTKNGNRMRNLEDVDSKLNEGRQRAKTWMVTEYNRPCQFQSLVLHVALKVNKISKVVYTNSGDGLLALASNAIHLLWKWPRHSNKATTKCPPQLYMPPSGILMTNDLTGTRSEAALACFALSKNDSYLISASGGKISLFNMMNFKTMMEFIRPPPTSTFLAFHPQDNNVIAIGMDDGTIHIYDVRKTEVKNKFKGHCKRITGLAFSIALNVLVSSGADAQIIVWHYNKWTQQNSALLQLPTGRAVETVADIHIQYHQDHIHFLAVHETQLAIYETTKLECVKQWVVRESSAPISHATLSCDSQMVFSCFLDGSIGLFCALTLQQIGQINAIAYLPTGVSSIVHPVAIAAHPKQPNQFAIGLTDGKVQVFEPLESEGQWGPCHPIDIASTSNAAPTVPPPVAPVSG